MSLRFTESVAASVWSGDSTGGVGYRHQADYLMAAIKQIKTKARREFGDFQTPLELARAATRTLVRLGVCPRSILEPTCGRGAFLSAAIADFPSASSIIGIDINRGHLALAEKTANQPGIRVKVLHGDFFKFDWQNIVAKSEGPWLILGNPPWVTSSELGSIESDNLPMKSNFHGRAGIEAITGKSNFDISEWMLFRYLEWLEGSEGTIAVLCKTAVARKILLHIWKGRKNELCSARMFKIDALGYFGAAVDACFFVLELRPQSHCLNCDVFATLSDEIPTHRLGFLDGHIITDAATFNLYRSLLGPDERYIWRSGVKHDCSKIMELTITQNGYQNGLGEYIALEDTFLFPMLKSSDIGNQRIHCRGLMVVTQRIVGEDTGYIKTEAPETWRYLKRHEDFLCKRASAVYRNKPPFSIFGVGSYSFAPWKIAISGFYKKLHFVKVGSLNGKPIVFDDTIYFLPCWSEEEADFMEALLQSEPATGFLNSMIHWDEKRPITVEILKRLNIQRLAALAGRERDYSHFTSPNRLPLFDSAEKIKTA